MRPGLERIQLPKKSPLMLLRKQSMLSTSYTPAVIERMEDKVMTSVNEEPQTFDDQAHVSKVAQ